MFSYVLTADTASDTSAYCKALCMLYIDALCTSLFLRVFVSEFQYLSYVQLRDT